MEKKYIVTMQQLRGPTWSTIMEVLPDERMAAPIYSKIMDSIENYLEDYCEEYQESE